MVAPGGGMRGFIRGGMHGFIRGACVVLKWGACVVLFWGGITTGLKIRGGMHVPIFGGGMRGFHLGGSAWFYSGGVHGLLLGGH